MTDRKEAEERLAVIAGELQHRVKNSFHPGAVFGAIVSAIADS